MDPSAGSANQAESNLMQVLTGILEDSVQTLKRIEKAVNESTKFTSQMLEKLDMIDKKIESGFVAVVKKALPALEHKFIEKINNVGGEMGDLTSVLPGIISKLQQSMQILSIQTLIKELDALPSSQKKKEKEPEAEKAKKENPPKKKPASPAAPAKPAPQEAPEPTKEEEPDKDGDHLLKPSSFFGS